VNANDLITVDPDILGGTPVFKGTRVPVKTLFDYLEGNYTLEEFLECFPSVTREMACRLLERSEAVLLTVLRDPPLLCAHRSSGFRPVRRASLASIRGPSSSPSWKAKT